MVVLRMERLILSLEKLVVCIIINLELEVNVFKLISVFNRVVIGKNIFILWGIFRIINNKVCNKL